MTFDGPQGNLSHVAIGCLKEVFEVMLAISRFDLIKKRLSTPQQITPKCKITLQKMVPGELQNQFYTSNLDQPSVQKVSKNHSKSKITNKKLVSGDVQGPILHK